MNEGEMSVQAMGAETVVTSIDTQQFQGIGPSDLREFLDRIERAGELKRITAEVDPIEEMSAIVYLAARENGAPAFLFERVKGYDIPVLWNMWGSSVNRLAAAMGVPMGLTHREMVLAVRNRLGRKIAPVISDSKNPPVVANTLTGDDIDVFRFPAPIHWNVRCRHHA